MYTILFHVSGIALLELCFYFYYIGPMETDIFTHTVKKLVDEPIDIFTPNADIIPFIPNTDSSKCDNYMYDMRQQGVSRREEKNHDLLMNTMKYWTLFFASSCSLVILYKCGCYMHNMRTTQIPVHAPKETEIVTIRSRKDSTDSDDLTVDHRLLYKHECNLLNDHTNDHTKTTYESIISYCNSYYNSDFENTYLYKTIYYTLYGACILSFQYFFFQNVVYYYTPLTIEEVKYIIYHNLDSDIKHAMFRICDNIPV